jgi:hypothetical protein
MSLPAHARPISYRFPIPIPTWIYAAESPILTH